tara:strand:+ start:40 stop:1044 length:1005 start_codon:yes stop_codon:yes gene_type:complete
MEMKDLIKQLLREGTFGNTSVDRNINQKVYKIMDALGVSRNESLEEKLKFLSNPSERLSDSDVRSHIAAIILLETLEELIKNFDGPSSGFLFESFLAGLMGGNVIEGNRPSDIYVGTEESTLETLDFTKDGSFYQSKLYASNSGNLKLKNWFNPNKKGEYSRSDKLIFGYKVGEESVNIYEVDVKEAVIEQIENGLYNDRLKDADLSGGLYLEPKEGVEEINYDVNFKIGDIVRNTLAGVIVYGSIVFNINILRGLGSNAAILTKNIIAGVYKSLTDFDEALTEMNSGIAVKGVGKGNTDERGVESSAQRAEEKLFQLRDSFADAVIALFNEGL